MRQWIIAATVLICSSFTLAAASPAPAPTPAPNDAADTPTKVLVAPFTEVNEQQQPDWISRAIQQAVADDLSSLGSVEVVPLSNPATSPSPAQAKGAGVKYIVRASIQRLNGDIRVTGRVQNVDDGKTVGGFKATGPQTALFAIEDSITQQLRSVIAPMEGDLQDARPLGGGARAQTTPGTTTPGATRGVFEGSDLQRALDDRDYLRRAQQRVPDYLQPNYYPPQQVYYPPTYPAYGYGGWGYGGGWNSCGWGWGCDGFNGGQVIIVGNGGSNGGNHGGGGGGVVTPRVPISTIQTQALRNAAVNPGQSGNFIGPAPYRAPVTNLKRTIPK